MSTRLTSERVRWELRCQRETLRSFVLSSICGSRLISRAVRPWLLRKLGHNIGICAIESGTTITGSKTLRVGNGSYLNCNCLIDLTADVDIGVNVHLGQNVRLITSSHGIGSNERRAGQLTALPVTIGDGAWIGAGAILLPGVDIASGCVVAAGSVVTKSTESNRLVAGVPARALRALSPSDPLL